MIIKNDFFDAFVMGQYLDNSIMDCPFDESEPKMRSAHTIDLLTYIGLRMADMIERGCVLLHHSKDSPKRVKTPQRQWKFILLSFLLS